ncbi:uncharacterized protein LOC112597412 [Melanaphis sacchari]|uniref:uncharacterized protein LOC112597412 n=1 Tax=Melanaphis sacchari TaxID=742174 RepID=UPI000DC13400|nr:uncharacterized protein LOC112597412 [Melanaphis sacchari]
MSGQSHGNQVEKWRRVAELISQLGLVSGDQDQPRTAAQVAQMSTHDLLQDPVRAAIYHRGWDERTADIQRTLQQPSPRAPNRHAQKARPIHEPPRRPQQPTAAKTVNKPSSDASRGPEPAPKTLEAPPTPPVRTRKEAQQARNKKKFLKLKEKRKARKQAASQNHRLAKHPTPTSLSETSSESSDEEHDVCIIHIT